MQAKRAIGKLTQREFLIAGTKLYWAEGTKSGDDLRISNADPLLMLFMVEWLRICLTISEDRLTASINYHEGQNEQLIREYWAKLIGLPLASFNKSFMKPPGTGHRKHYLQWGVCRIRVRRSADLFHKFLAGRTG